MNKRFLLPILIFCVGLCSAQESTDVYQERFEAIALKLWNNPELGYQETLSSELLKGILEDEGFSIIGNLADIPTAFRAVYGESGPTIGILGEFDALPGLSQTNSPFQEKASNPNGAGHACGHHLFGAGSAWAAVMIKQWLIETKTPGRIIFFGTPAEEGGSGKVYMAREGAFENVDIMFHWHPSSSNQANSSTSNANKSGKFTFKGISAHAASAPDKGRSALDGVEAMNMMVNMMREHIPQESRIHYVITKGGLAPNVVPDLAEVYYYVRHPDRLVVKQLFERVVKAAEGAAMGTETKLSYEVMHGNYSLMPNDTVQKLLHSQLSAFGGIEYTAAEQKYAEQIYETLFEPSLKLGDEKKIMPYKQSHTYGSTDVGDVSWLIPTAGIRTATWVPGTSAHSWQAVAAGGMSIGLKGMKLAAKVLTASATKIYENPEIIVDAKQELAGRVGEDFKYEALLGDRDPPLDYRVN